MISDAPTSLIVLSFSDIIGKKSNKDNKINIRLENKADFLILAKVRLNFSGLMRFDEYVDLGEYTLKSGELQKLKFSLEQVPIQSETHIGQIRAEVEYKDIEREGDAFSKFVTPGYYYIFEEDFKAFKLFDATVLNDVSFFINMPPL
ncbi:MAG: hypothetical protein JXR91_15420 [Deltaproteobacteria bacterium]|nr:hypothetical protein [Deltaproteobacteria bacterium]